MSNEEDYLGKRGFYVRQKGTGLDTAKGFTGLISE